MDKHFAQHLVIVKLLGDVMAGYVKFGFQLAINKVFMKIIYKPLNPLAVGQPIQRSQEKQAREISFGMVGFVKERSIPIGKTVKGILAPYDSMELYPAR
jgi:hypothetical protein